MPGHAASRVAACEERAFRLALVALLPALMLVLLLAAVPAPAQQTPRFPVLAGRVTDAADIIPPTMEAKLEEKLAALESQSGRQLVVATVPALQGYDIADYGYQLGRHWGIGDKGRNDGALLIVAPAERQLRIEIGYGLEGVLTDGFSSLIINQTILPRFREGDMAGGIDAGTDAIIHQLTLPPEEARKIAAQAADQPESGGFPIAFLIFILIFFVLPVIGGMRGAKGSRRSGLPGVVVWPTGGFGGGGWSGGGGFSGGGGSFGGGGASGRW